MKTLKLLPVLSLIVIFAQSCDRRSVWGIRGSGPNVSEQRYTPQFDRIKLSMDAEVTLIQDSVFSVEVIGQSNILAVFETKVEGKELILSYRRSVWDHNTVRAIIHAPAVVGLSVSGSGTIRVEKELKGEGLNLDVSGSGAINIPKATLLFLDADVSGSGKIGIDAGIVNSEDLHISGSGEIDLEYVKCSANVSRISGSGSARVNVTESLKVYISGSGSLFYRGNPNIQSDISGSGRLIRIN